MVNFILFNLCPENEDADMGSSDLDDRSTSEGEYSTMDDVEVSREAEELSPDKKKRKTFRGTEEIVTEKLCLLLDRCNISNRDALRVIIATSEALGFNSLGLILNRETIRLRRQKFRQQWVELIKDRFTNSDLEGAVVHWDGKLLPDILGKEVVERLAVLISCGPEEQLIAVPKLENNRGISQAKAVVSAVAEWGATEKIQAMCFDTTSTNTGCYRGACVIIEQLFKRDLLHLACRHHILEVILRAVFECKMGTTTGPHPDIFKKFCSQWSKLDKAKYRVGIEEDSIKSKIINIDEISGFLTENLAQQQPRDDYKEFLQLCLIFLGKIPSKDVSFRIPGAIHHARWMAKAIYSLKIYLFRDQFSLTHSQRKCFEDICLFIVNIYVKAWFTAPSPTLAPHSDIKLLKSLVMYREIDCEIAENALSKIQNHLWYLSSEVVAFSFFDESLEKNVKIRMASKLTAYDKDYDHGEDRDVKAVLTKEQINNILDKDLDFFVTPATLRFFERFKIDTDFLMTDPDEWQRNENFVRANRIVRNLKVVNDSAERGVKLMTDFNTCLTKDEEQKQYLLQVVAECRKLYPDASKATLCLPLAC